MSSIHVDDIAASVVAALDVEPGTYNVSEDAPISQEQYMAAAAAALGAPAPRRVPHWLARIVMGRFADVFAASQRVSNQRFREAAGWRPAYSSFLEGWPEVVRAEAAVPGAGKLVTAGR